MTDRSWKLLVKLIEACGFDVSEIEDQFDFDELCDTMKSRTQEYEELKEENQKLEMQLCNDCGERDDYNIPCKTIRDLEYGLQKEIEENDRYRKALKEIEEYCVNQNLKFDTTACKILDIIDKAKEGHNE